MSPVLSRKRKKGKQGKAAVVKSQAWGKVMVPILKVSFSRFQLPQKVKNLGKHQKQQVINKRRKRSLIKKNMSQNATTDYEDIGHSNDAQNMMHKYYIGEIDKETVPQKCVYVQPNDWASKPDKNPEFIIKILQYLVPLMILGLAFGIRSYTKEKSA